MEDIYEMLEYVLDLEKGDFEAGTNLDDIEEWDSLAKLSLLAETKKRYGKMISPDDVNTFKTIHDIVVYIEGLK